MLKYNLIAIIIVVVAKNTDLVDVVKSPKNY